MKKIAVIVAGGSGQRMGAAIPKQFLLLKGKPLIWHTIKAFLDAYQDIKLIVVLPEANLNAREEIARDFQSNNLFFTAGGQTRFHSVQNGINFFDTTNSIVFVHDGVRCLITPELIKRCYEQAKVKGSAIPAVAATDSIRISTGADESVVADRNLVRIVQTPQTFTAELLVSAFKQMYSEAFTDEATVVEAFGSNVFLIEGDYSNLKITRPLDLIIAEQILVERQASSIS